MSGENSGVRHTASHTITFSDPNWSESFLAGPMFMRMCSRCGALTLEGARVIHDLWHTRTSS